MTEVAERTTEGMADTVTCTCGRAMSYTEQGTWRCLACNPEVMDTPKCKTVACKRPLTRLGDPWNCWICLHCNDHPDVVNKRDNRTEKPDRTYVDKTLTPDSVKDLIKKELAGVPDMIREAMSEFSISKEEDDPDYPPSRLEIEEMVAPMNVNAGPDWGWLKKAVALGVKTHKDTGGLRKKADIVADTNRKEQDEANQQSADQGSSVENAESSGGEPERDG